VVFQVARFRGGIGPHYAAQGDAASLLDIVTGGANLDSLPTRFGTARVELTIVSLVPFVSRREHD
jgi:hypothetical protein